MNVLAVIPARGGSIGLPRKNVLSLCGRPVLAYTIDHVRESERVSKVVLATDSPEISNIAVRDGIQVVHLPTEIADNPVADAAVVYCMNELASLGYAADFVILAYANMPIRPSKIFDRCITALMDSRADTIVTVFQNTHCHPRYAVTVDDNGCRSSPWGEARTGRQEFEKCFFIDGSCIISRADIFQGDGSHWFLPNKKHIVLDITGEPHLEIDSADDLVLAEKIISKK